MPKTNNLKFKCEFCSQSLEAEKDMSGMELECPSCQKTIIVPSMANERLQNSQGRTQKTPDDSKKEQKKFIMGMFVGCIPIYGGLIGAINPETTGSGIPFLPLLVMYGLCRIYVAFFDHPFSLSKSLRIFIHAGVCFLIVCVTMVLNIVFEAALGQGAEISQRNYVAETEYTTVKRHNSSENEYNIGGKVIVLPPPPGFVKASDSFLEKYHESKRGISNMETIAWFVLESEKNIEGNTVPEFSRYFQVSIVDILINDNISNNEFSKFKMHQKNEFKTMERQINKQFELLKDELGENISDEFKSRLIINNIGQMMLEPHYETDNIYSYTT